MKFRTVKVRNGSVRGVCEESQLELLSGPEDGRAEVVYAVIPDSLLIADVKRSVTAVGPLATIGVCSHSEAAAGISEIIVVQHSAPGFGKGRGGLASCMVEGMKIKLLPSLCITELIQAVFGGGGSGFRRGWAYGKPAVRLHLGSEDDGAGFGFLAGDYLYPGA